MHHFNYKSLTLYGVAIGAVVLLFKSVSAFGESQLKAPPKISDRYHLHITNNPPNCEKSPDLIFNIQQSGIYVNASLLPANSNTKTSAVNDQKHSLTGIFKNQQMQLSGKIDSSLLCPVNSTQPSSPQLVTIQMQIKDQNYITGQLIINNASSNLQFTATPDNQSSTNTKNHE